MGTERRLWRQRLLILVPLLASLVASCHWGDAGRPGVEAVRLVWPSPPDQARVEWVSAFGGAADLGIKPSLWSRLATLVGGADDPEIVRPTGVAVDARRIAVADPGAARVQLYDLTAQKAHSLTSCDASKFAEPVAVAFLGQRLFVADAARGRIDSFDADGECVGGWDLEKGARPAGLAADATRSRLYVSDSGKHQVLVFDPQGALQLRFGERGAAPGEFNFPTWMAVDAGGTLYVTDGLNFRVQRFDPDGRCLGVFGQQGDGSGELARPKGIGVDAAGHVYLVDALFDAVQLFDGDGRYLMVFGGRGHDPGQFWLPSGLAVDGDRIYVVDTYNQRVQIFRSLGGAS